MISKERVIELTHMAVYEQHEDKPAHQSGEYYGRDYVGKEILKSIFSGTLAFAVVLGLILLCGIDTFLNRLASDDIVTLIIEVGLVYVLFMVLYLAITAIIFSCRFKRGRNQLREYYKRLKKVNKMYDRDEKLKE